MSCKFQKLPVCHLLAVLLMLGAYSSSECIAQTVLKIGGTGAALGAMSKIAEAFHKLHPDIEVKILPSLGSSGGIKAVTAGALQIAFSSRQLKSEELAAGLIELEYARTPFVFVTRNPVGVAGVTSEGVVQMFSGAIPAWPNGQRIRPIIRPDEETDTHIAKAISAGLAKTLDSLQKVPGMVVALTDQDCSEAIGAVSGTLAFTSLSQVLTWERKCEVLSFNGIVPSVANLSNSTYPFYRSFYLLRKAEAGESAGLFVDFIRSPQARKILEETGNQPLVKTLAEN